MYTRGAFPEVLGSLGEGPFISGKQNAKYLRGSRELGSKHLIMRSWEAVSKYKYIHFQGAGEINSVFSGSKDSP